MIDRSTLAGIAAGLTALVVAGLFLRRSGALNRPGGEYPLLQRATLFATAVAAGALSGLAVFLLVSGSGG